jgi:signal transduction histidine kinase/ligand-binding sensor domain-containing protein
MSSMHRGPLRFALALLALLSASAGSTGDSAYFESVGDGDSIPDGVVTALAEDSAGFLWLGTPSGLIRYDGYRLRRYTHERNDPASLGGNLIRSLLASRDGRLWIGTDADGLSVFDPSDERFTTFRPDDQDPDAISAGAIFALAEAADGRLWIGSRGGGVTRLDPVSGRFERMRHDPSRPGSLPDDRVNALLVDRDDRLWVGTWNGLARHTGQGRFEAVPQAADADNGIDDDDDRVIYSLFQADDQKIWIGTRGGNLFRSDPAGQLAERLSSRGAAAGGTASAFSFTQPHAGEIWLGRTNGLEIRDAASGALLRTLQHDPAVRSSLAGNDIRSLLLDRAGLLWAGGFGSGLQRHDPQNQAIRVFRHQAGHSGVLSDPNIVSVLQARDGTLWLGTRGTGVAILDASMQLIGGYRPDPDRSHGLQAGWITALEQTGDDAIWLGSRDGLHRFDPVAQRFTAFRSAQGLLSESVRRLLAGEANTLWVGTGDGLFRVRSDSHSIERMRLAGGEVLGGDINALALDAAGNLWVGGARGLYRLDAGSAALRTVADGLNDGLGDGIGHSSVLGLLVDREDTLWIDTADGLYRLLEWNGDRARIDAVSERLGIAGSDFGANLMQDAAGFIWTHRYRFDPVSGSLHALSRTDGVDFGTGWFRAHAKAADGRLLFGGSQGLLVIDPSQFRQWVYTPPVVVTELRIDGLPRPLDKGTVQLPADSRSFSIEFAALDYSAPDRNQYRYRLQGFDRAWLSADANHRVAAYSNLWPGGYLLEIEGSNRIGQFGAEPLQIPIRVLPAWWQSGWFGALLLLVLVAMAYLSVAWRTARIQRRARTLERLVDQRTAELSLQVRRTEQAMAELTGAQDQLVAAEKLASLGQLVAGVSHEINTPIGIALTAASHLNETTREQREKLDHGTLTRTDLAAWQQMTEEASRLILGSLQRAHALIGSFKRVAVDQSSEQRRSFDLREFLDEVQFALQPSYRRSPHALSIECPPGIIVDTYPGALFQILTNFVTNSLMHGFADDQAGHMSIRIEPTARSFVMRYRDDGVGMPDAVARHAFDPFFTTRRGSGGSGLGLHLAYNLATRLLGGRIELNSQPGSGTEFVLTLPRHAPEHSVKTKLAARDVAGTGVAAGPP